MGDEASAGSAVTSDQIQPFPENVDAQQGSWANVPAQRVTLDDGSSAIIKIWDSGDGTYLNVLMRGNRDGSTDTLGVVPNGTGYPDPEALTAPGGYSAGNGDRGGIQSPTRSLVNTPEEEGGLWQAFAPVATAVGGAVAGRYGARRFAPELRDLSRIRASEMLADMSAAPRPYDALMRPMASGVVRSTPETFTAATGLAGQTLGGAAGGALGAIATGQEDSAGAFALAGGAGALAAPAAVRAGREGLEIARDGGREFGSAFRQFSRDTRERLTPAPKPASAAAIRRAQPDRPIPPPQSSEPPVSQLEDAVLRSGALDAEGVPPVPGRRGIEERTQGGAASQLTRKASGVSNDDLAALAERVGEEVVTTKKGVINRSATAKRIAAAIAERPKLGRVLREEFPNLPLAILVGVGAGAGALSEDGPFAPMAR